MAFYVTISKYYGMEYRLPDECFPELLKFLQEKGHPSETAKAYMEHLLKEEIEGIEAERSLNDSSGNIRADR